MVTAQMLISAGRAEEALVQLDRLLAREPRYVEALVQRSLVMILLARYEEALASADLALEISRAHPNAHSYRGSALLSLGQAEAALKAYDQVIALAPQAAVAHYNRANALQRLGRWNDALPSLKQALKLQPAYPDAWVLLGQSALALGEREQALLCYDNALAIDPKSAAAHYNKGLLLLSLGRLDQGWLDYDWRLAWEKTIRQSQSRSVARVAPDWRGQPLDRPLLVIPEQGIGDQIFYAGMLADLEQEMPGSTVCVEPRLQTLFARSFPALNFSSPDVIDAAECIKTGRFGAQIHLGSLGQYFRRSQQDLQAIRPAYLKADPAASGALRSRLHASGKLVCGLSWISKNGESGRDKSLDLRALLPLLTLPGIEFVDLQYGDTSAERQSLETDHGVEIRKLDDIDNFQDIDGLAALIQACDIVVTVSNTTAHLAAALGKPVLIMLPSSTALFWYWHFDRIDSPWYPTAVLLRQTVSGNWSDVLANLTAAVLEFAKACRG